MPSTPTARLFIQQVNRAEQDTKNGPDVETKLLYVEIQETKLKGNMMLISSWDSAYERSEF